MNAILLQIHDYVYFALDASDQQLFGIKTAGFFFSKRSQKIRCHEI
jgi:hypothetical protein